MNRIILAFLASLSLVPAATAASLTDQTWIVRDRKALNGRADLSSQAQALIKRLTPDGDITPPRVGEARFADVDHDGRLELLATVDFSGRDFFTTIVVVRNIDGRMDMKQVQGNGVSITRLADRLQDVDRDGKLELITEQYIDRYEGAEAAPKDVLVYRWRSGRFVEASEEFPEYYRTSVVPELRRKLAQASQSSKGPMAKVTASSETFVLRAELARAKQRAGM